MESMEVEEAEDSDEGVDAAPPLRVASNVLGRTLQPSVREDVVEEAAQFGLHDAGPSRLGAPLRPGLYWHRPDDSEDDDVPGSIAVDDLSDDEEQPHQQPHQRGEQLAVVAVAPSSPGALSLVPPPTTNMEFNSWLSSCLCHACNFSFGSLFAFPK